MVEDIEIETSDHRVGRSGIGYRRLFLIKQGKFAGTGLNESFGIMFDSAGNIYAANGGNDTIEKFSATGADLGVFAYTYPKPHFMTMFRPSHRHFENETLKRAGKVAALQDSE